VIHNVDARIWRGSQDQPSGQPFTRNSPVLAARFRRPIYHASHSGNATTRNFLRCCHTGQKAEVSFNHGPYLIAKTLPQLRQRRLFTFAIQRPLSDRQQSQSNKLLFVLSERWQISGPYRKTPLMFQVNSRRSSPSSVKTRSPVTTGSHQPRQNPRRS
jgi:hypothetical protein